MKIKTLLLFLLVTCLAKKHVAQTKKLDTVFCDCNQARIINIKDNQTVGLTIAPPNAGQKQEISETKQGSPYTFKKEHHTAWYKLIIAANGNLSFTIIPKKSDDDYDFMLFQATKNNFCDSLDKYKLKPLRANISRDKDELSGKTGLTINAPNNLVKQGVNDAYSTAMPVSKGQVYYLVLDNVYDKGEGHTIDFFFEQNVTITGTVNNDGQQALITQIAVVDSKGQTTAQTTSDAAGNYQIQTTLKKNVNYTINYFNDSSFVYSKNISLKDTVSLKDIRVILPQLKKGKKYTIGSINFFGGDYHYLPISLPSVQNLFKLMQKNTNLKILIEGHTNGCDPGVQVLSQMRADQIKKFLVLNGIDKSRVETLGKGCKEMLFSPKGTETQQEQNRRVEIKILDY